jgi:signal transduction histidine kinase
MSSSRPFPATRELPAPEGPSGWPQPVATHIEATEIHGALADLERELHAAFAERNRARAERDAAIAERDRLRVELEVRNCALDADITARLEEDASRRRLQEQLVTEMRERDRMTSERRLAQKLEAVGQLAAGIAHEINTPVQYVGDSVYFLQTAARDLEGLLALYRREIEVLPPGGALQAARDRLNAAEARADLEFLRDEVPKAIERALDGIGRVTHIVRAVREFAHPDTQEQKPADINRAIETTMTVARNEYKYCATVITELGALPEVVCNVGELNQVLVNLIVNAAHAIQESGQDATSGRITITTQAIEDAAVIRVADNGCGIPDKNLERIFDPFFTTKEVGKGTGQGLSIARSIIVERHGGRIDVTSQVGAGTEFTIRLPIAGRNGALVP